MTTIDTLKVDVVADTSAFRKEIEAADKLAKGFGASLNASLAGGVARGQSLTQVMQNLALRLSTMALRQALKPVTDGAAGLFETLFGALKGGAAQPGQPLDLGSFVTPMAKGGVVAAPSYFPLGGGRLGLMGEAGPEAVLPLQRGADGRLGVAAAGGAATSIVLNVTTPDAQSFRRSEAEIAATLARAVTRGRRGL